MVFVVFMLKDLRPVASGSGVDLSPRRKIEDGISHAARILRVCRWCERLFVVAKWEYCCCLLHVCGLCEICLVWRTKKSCEEETT